MIGTSDEILMWLTEHSEYAPLLQMSRQRLVGLRKHLRCGEVSEGRKDEILERLKNNPRPGLRALLEATGLADKEVIRAYLGTD